MALKLRAVLIQLRRGRREDPTLSLFHHDVVVGKQFVALGAEDFEIGEAPLLQAVLEGSGQYPEAVFDAARETDAGVRLAEAPANAGSTRLP